MRQRVEDLGRIAVLCENALDMDFFDQILEIRSKDFVDHFRQLPQEKQDEMLVTVSYDLRSLQEKIYEIRDISRGEDALNEPARIYD